MSDAPVTKIIDARGLAQRFADPVGKCDAPLVEDETERLSAWVRAWAARRSRVSIASARQLAEDLQVTEDKAKDLASAAGVPLPRAVGRRVLLGIPGFGGATRGVICGGCGCTTGVPGSRCICGVWRAPMDTQS